jgi:hypothetical protein
MPIYFAIHYANLLYYLFSDTLEKEYERPQITSRNNLTSFVYTCWFLMAASY